MNQGAITVDAVRDFLLPNFSDILQVSFFVAIFGLAFLTTLFVKLRAREKNWNNRWTANSSSAGAEYDSLMDFSQAVATKPEKLAEIAPGVLLILGLLGTFLGLGLALDHASNILQSASSAASMDGAMDELMKMMGGLGTKFKTSTWGIIAFLVMKAWFAWDGHEDLRNEWCMEKMKTQQDNTLSKLKIENDIRSHNSALLTATEVVGAIKLLGESLTINFTALQRSIDGSLKQGFIGIIQSIEADNSKIIEAMEGASKQNISAIEANNSSMDDIKNMLGDVIKNTSDTNETLSSFVETNKESMKSISESSGKMELAASEISGAAKTMSAAASGLEGSAGNLQEAISGFKKEIGTVMSDLDTSLTETLQKIQTDFVESMVEGSGQLSSAATLISESIDKLPESVNKAMQPVKDGISHSVSLQTESVKKIAIVCDDASKAIIDASEQMLEAKSVIKSMGDKISESLGSVGSSNREVSSSNIRVSSSNDNITEGYKLISTKLDQFSASIMHLTRVIDASSKESASSLSSLESLSCSLIYLESIKNNLDQMARRNESLDQVDRVNV